MTKEQWQNLYDDLYHINHQFGKLYFDVFENTAISKKQSNESKVEVDRFMSSAYSKIQYNQEVCKLFEKDKNINDLKHAGHFEWNITPFLHDIKMHIEKLS
jgi:hypothetical protein